MKKDDEKKKLSKGQKVAIAATYVIGGLVLIGSLALVNGYYNKKAEEIIDSVRREYDT